MAWDATRIDTYGPWGSYTFGENGSTGTDVADFPLPSIFDGASDVEDELRSDVLRLEARLAAEQVKRQRAEAKAELAQDQSTECERLRRQVAELRPAALAFYKLQREIQARFLLPNTKVEERDQWEHWTAENALGEN